MQRVRWLLLLALPLCPTAVRAAEDTDDDERLLRTSDYPVDGPGLLEVFRKRTPSPAVAARARALLRQCGSESFDVREQASANLLALGPLVRPLLREAVHDPDPEIARRAADGLAALERPDEPACLEAAVRLLAQRRPEGGAAVLLAFTPFAEEETLADEIALALARTGVRDGRPDPLLVRALADRHPLTRAVAGEALARGGAADHRDAVRKLLADPDPAVRERVALALVETRDREAVPALIRLVGELPRARRYRVESALYAAAGDKAPPPVPGEDAAARRQRLDGWEEWWRTHGAAVELPKVEPGQRLLGHTLITMMGPRGFTGRVLELDAAGQVRWELGGLRYPIDAQVLGPDRVLVVEYTDRTVSERNLRGETLWSKTLNSSVLAARRLPDGRTFIATRNQVLEVGRDGREDELIARPGDIAGAVRLRNRQVAVVTGNGECVFYDAAGRELRSVPLGGSVLSTGCGFEVLANGNVLVPLYTSGRVVEIDPKGQVVWEATVRYPTSAQRLPSGNTLICSRIGSTVVELDRDGRQVWEYQPGGRPVRAMRR